MRNASSLFFTLTLSVCGLHAQIADDFNDGNDTGWKHLDLGAFGLPASFKFPSDGAGGMAYQIITPPSPPIDAAVPRAFSYRQQSFDRFVAATDILDFKSGPTIDQAFGLLVRADNIALGETTGYVMNYNEADGDLQINRVTGEAPTTIAETHLPLDHGKTYRFVMTCWDANLVGQVFVLPDLTNPIGAVVATDVEYGSGDAGLFVFDRNGTDSFAGADATFDNFTADALPAGAVPPLVFELAPRPASVALLDQPTIRLAVLDGETPVVPSSFTLKLDGQVVPTADFTVEPAVTAPNDPQPFTGATLSYTPPAKPTGPAIPSGTHAVEVGFKDGTGKSYVQSWSFTTRYLENPAGPGATRGFNVRVTQAQKQDAGLGNSLARAELQLAENSPITKRYDTNVLAAVINYSQLAIVEGAGNPLFEGDAPIPGQEVDGPTDNYAMEVTTYLDLPQGTITLGVYSDDGFSVQSGALLLGAHDGGPAKRDDQSNFSFYVATAGLYPFRLVWYENTGDAFVEWFSVTGTPDAFERSLLNSDDAGAIKAYRSLVQVLPTATLQSSASVGSGYADDPTSVPDAAAHRFTVPINGDSRYYRIKYSTGAPPGPPITSIKIVGPNVVIEYQ